MNDTSTNNSAKRLVAILLEWPQVAAAVDRLDRRYGQRVSLSAMPTGQFDDRYLVLAACRDWDGTEYYLIDEHGTLDGPFAIDQADLPVGR